MKAVWTSQGGLGFYAQEMGFNPQNGDNLLLVSFYETSDHMGVSKLVKLTNGESVELRDESGRPRWAGWSRGG